MDAQDRAPHIKGVINPKLMGPIILIILGFVCLVVIAIWYDKIMAYITFPKNSELSNLFQTKMSDGNKIQEPRWKIKPLQLIPGLFFTSFACYEFLQGPHFQNFAPGAQSSERWGAPVHNYAFAVAYLVLGIYFLIGAIKKNKDAPEIHKTENGSNKDRD